MKCPARENGKGVGGVWLGPQCLRNLKDPPSETVPKGNNLKHAVVGGGEMCRYNREGPLLGGQQAAEPLSSVTFGQ